MIPSLIRRVVYESAYLFGKARWDSGVTPPEVTQVVEVEHFPPGRALDIGCGTGTNVIYFAQHGFATTGVDFVPRAIARARAKAQQAQVSVDLRVMNVLEATSFAAPFDIALDIGCFHNFGRDEQKRYADNLARWTRSGSLYLLYAFYPQQRGRRNIGVSQEEVSEAFVPAFKIIDCTVSKSIWGSDSAWYRLERK